MFAPASAPPVTATLNEMRERLKAEFHLFCQTSIASLVEDGVFDSRPDRMNFLGGSTKSNSHEVP